MRVCYITIVQITIDLRRVPLKGRLGTNNTTRPRPGGGRGAGVLRLSFARYVPLGSQRPYFITVYSVAYYRPHLSHFWLNNVIFPIPTFMYLPCQFFK